MKYIFSGFIFILLNIQNVYNQSINQPCARILAGLGGDSVLWSAQPCANFDAYLVYGRSNPSAAFSLLATISNPNQFGTVHANSTETAWEYKIEMRCGGALAGSTSVVSNQKPITPDLRAVNIVNGQAVLSWDRLPTACKACF